MFEEYIGKIVKVGMRGEQSMSGRVVSATDTFLHLENLHGASDVRIELITFIATVRGKN